MSSSPFSFRPHTSSCQQDLGGKDIKDQTDSRITHYIVVLPEHHRIPKKRFHTWEVPGDWKWQYVIREHAKWYTESENGFDVERNWKEGRTRMVVGREWLKEVIVGQLDPWSALGQGQGSASNSAGVEKGEVIEQEQGRWEIWYILPYVVVDWVLIYSA